MNHSMALGKGGLSARSLLVVTAVTLGFFFATATGFVIGGVAGVAVRPIWAVISPAYHEPTSAPEAVGVSPTKFAYAASTDTNEGQPTQSSPTAGAKVVGVTPSATATAVTVTPPTPTKTKAVATASRTPLPRPTATVAKLADPVYKASDAVRGPGGCDQYVVISGAVKDGSGKPVTGVNVHVTWKDNGSPRSGLFDDGGNTIKSDAAGNWRVETPVKNASFRRVDFSAAVVSDDGAKTFSPVVDFFLPACQMNASAQVNFDKQ